MENTEEFEKHYFDTDTEKLKKHFYDSDTIVSYNENTVFFGREEMKNVVGAEKLSYDEYLDIQIKSLGQQRIWFAMCYIYQTCYFTGQIEKINNDKICFTRIFVEGMYDDGVGFLGREDHVWMDKKGFENFKKDDCLRFSAEVYRYVKTKNGKLIDFALRNPENIELIESYELPSDDDLLLQSINNLICETCLFWDHCDGLFCLRNKEEIDNIRDELFHIAKSQHKEEAFLS